MDCKQLAQICAQIAEDRKAKDIKVLHVEKNFILADYFVVCTGNTERHVKSISQEIQTELKKNHGAVCHHIEGYQEGKWILMDFIDVIVHIYLEETRDYYELEDLWADAPKMKNSEAENSEAENSEVENSEVENSEIESSETE